MSPVRVLHVAQAAPEVGGIASFVEMISGPAVFGPGITTEVLNRNRPGRNRGAGRLSLVNLRRTLADAASVYRAARHADVVQIHTSPLPVGPLLRAVALSAAARAAGAGVICHIHASLTDRAGDFSQSGLYRRLLPLLQVAHRAITVTDVAKDILAEVGFRSGR